MCRDWIRLRKTLVFADVKFIAGGQRGEATRDAARGFR